MNFLLPTQAGRRSNSQRIRPQWKLQPTFEQLDQRLALTASATSLPVPADLSASGPLRVEAVIPLQNPYANTPLVTVPANSPAFSIHFNQAIDVTSLSTGDFRLFQIASDGSSKELVQPRLQYLENGNAADASSMSLVLSFISPLDPGEYRLLLAATNSIQNQAIQKTTPSDQLIDEFTVGVQAANSIPVRLMGSITQDDSIVTLPVVSNDMHASLNQLDLPAGANWTIDPNFGDADPELYRFGLFDSQKQLILSAKGSNLLGLNQGLHSGRYYLQVYRTSSTAGLSNPTISLTISGTLAQPESVAVPTVVPFNWNGSDPNADTLLIDLTGIEVTSAFFDPAQSGFTLTDQTGQSWPVTPSGYDRTAHQLTLTLAGYLPTGQYTVAVRTANTPGSGPSVQNLGSFDNVFQELPADNLGTIFPDAENSSGHHPTELSPGQTVTHQFAVVLSERYQVDLSNPNLTGVLIQVIQDAAGRSANRVIDPGVGKSFSLEPGVYQIVVTNDTPISQLVSFAVNIKRVLPISLSAGGVGQLPATLTQGTLVANAPEREISQNVVRPRLDTVADVAAPVAIRPAPAPDSKELDSSKGRVEVSESFHSSVLLQAPLGSLSHSTTPTPHAPTSTHHSDLSGSMPDSVQNSIFLNMSPPNSLLERGLKQHSSPINLPGSPAPQQGPGLPQNLSDLRTDAGPFVANDLPQMGQIEAGGLGSLQVESAEVSAPEPTQLLASLADWRPTKRLGLVASEAEPAEPTDELAGMASPIAIAVATCVVIRQLKAFEIGVKVIDRKFLLRAWRSGTTWIGSRRSAPGRMTRTRSSHRFAVQGVLK